ncbi:MAG: hypothetical protein A2X46_14940 [Lentisphaerae bacterium GWF2_57_35]|nr:MAG: hypothetical protein A2X46_14940 [Lentisphaerae bacterium GWF2_57_35]
MKTYSDKQYVELFHLIFLAQMGRKIDKRFYVLKGGCNLRFFFKSPRYSEVMDLDVKDIPVHKLADQVGGILESKPFAQILQVRGMSVVHINNDKQTPTTQRWKLGLGIPGVDRPVPTKIEFSRRGMEEDMEFAPVDALVTSGYELPPVLANHYSKQAAYGQKIRALADRKETQARDIFDLHLLLGMGADPRRVPKKAGEKLAEAMDKALTLDFGVFASQVLAYLPAEDRDAYDADAWDAIRLRVFDALKEGAS